MTRGIKMDLEVKTWYWISDPNEGDIFTPAYVAIDGRILIGDDRYEMSQFNGLTFTKAVMPEG